MNSTGWMVGAFAFVLVARSGVARADASDDEAYEVVVQGGRSEPATESLSKEEVRRMPGALGDPFRAIEALPGVVATVSGLPFFYVRGAPPGNVGYYLDGVRVPYLFHVLGGPSIIHPSLIERVDLHTAAYPARFGRYAGGIVAATTTPPTESWQAEGTLRLTDVGALAEASFADGRATALVAGRYAYPGPIVSAISPALTLDYRDFQARVTFDVTHHDRISVFAFGAYDFVSVTQPGGFEAVDFATEFYRVDVRYDAALEGGGTLRAAVTSGVDDTVLEDGRRARNIIAGSRVLVRQPVGAHVALDLGFDVQHDVYQVDPPKYFDPDDAVQLAFNRLFRSRPDGTVGTWLGLRYLPVPELLVEPAVRVDAFQSDGTTAVGVAPRLQVSVQASDRVRLLHAVGVSNQPPSYLVPVPGVAPAGLEAGLQTALQASASVQVELPWATTASLGVFDNVFLNMSDALQASGLDALPHDIPRSLGAGKGVEVYLRRSLSRRLGGFVSYTFSRSTRSVGTERVVATFDRTHVFSTAVGAEFGHGWLGGIRFSLRSGTPVADGTRTPFFTRFDFRFEKRWQLSRRSRIAMVWELINAGFKQEVLPDRVLPPVVLPSFGVEAAL